MTKKFCTKCGKELKESEKFCPSCGVKFSNESEPKKENSSFIKEHKKLVLCLGGIFLIFVIFALVSISGNQTDVDTDLSSGIETVLEDADYSVSTSVEEGVLKLNAVNVDLDKRDSNSEIIEVYIFDSDILNEVASEYGLSPRELNGIEGYGGYSQKIYTYSFVENGNTVVIFAPSEDSDVLNSIVKDY